MRTSSRLKSEPAAPAGHSFQQLGALPGPRGLPLIGSFLPVVRDPLNFLEDAVRTYGSPFRFRVGPFEIVQLHDPDQIRHVLVENPHNYRKSPTYQVLRDVLGNGLVTSEGSFWRKQRRLAQPAFHHKSLQGFADTMANLTAELIDEWKHTGREIDLHAAMTKLTLRIVGHTLMSTELADQADTIGQAVHTILDYANHPETNFILPRWVPTLKRHRAKGALATLDAIIYEMIAERRASGRLGTDLLGMLMAATDADTQEQMSALQLRDELVTMLLAGHETTANALSWTFLLFGRHPQVAARVASEADKVLGQRSASLEAIKELSYTDAAVRESMRLYPPVWAIEREAVAADRIGDLEIPAKTLVAISPWTLHRDPNWYPNPEAYLPDRFLDGSRATNRYTYLPFGGGPRTCIGNAFAMMEVKLITAMIAREFVVAISPGQRIRPKAGVTLRPDPGIRARIRPR